MATGRRHTLLLLPDMQCHRQGSRGYGLDGTRSKGIHPGGSMPTDASESSSSKVLETQEYQGFTLCKFLDRQTVYQRDRLV